MIIATFRDGAAELADPLAECLVDLQRSEAVTRVRVWAGLDTAERRAVRRRQRSTRSWTVICATSPPRPRNAAAATPSSSASCGGTCCTTVWSPASDDRWVVRRDIATVGAPDSVKEVVAGRMARLSRRARRPLELAAVAGQRVEFQVLSLAAEMSRRRCQLPGSTSSSTAGSSSASAVGC